MSELAVIIGSVFGLIGIGYGAARTRLLEEPVGIALADFVFTVAIPVLLFRTLAKADFAGITPWELWLTYFSGVCVTWLVAHKLIRRMFRRDARSGVVAGVSASFSNTVLIGIPLVQTVVGEQGMVALLVILSIHLPVMMLNAIILFEWALRVDGIQSGAVDLVDFVKRFATSLTKNPIVIGIVAGALWRYTGLPLSGVPARLVDSLSQVAGPMALFSAGMGLARYGIARNVPQAMVITFLKLVVMPSVVLFVGLSLELPRVFLVAAVITAACPTGVNAYLIAIRFGTGQAISSNSMTLSTALGVVTTSIWLVILNGG